MGEKQTLRCAEELRGDPAFAIFIYRFFFS
jgi:hypothetical protein